MMRNTMIMLMLILLTSCNMFSIFEEDSAVESVAEKYRDGNFVSALNEVNKALKSDPRNSDLLYYRVKIRLQLFYSYQGQFKPLDAIELVEQIIGANDLSDPIVPFYNTFHDPFERHGVKNIQGLAFAEQNIIDLEIKNNELSSFPFLLGDLKLIYNNQTFGTINKEYIKSDYGMLLVIYGLVKLRDTNSDDLLNLNDYKFPIGFSGKDAKFTKIPETFIAEQYLNGIPLDSLIEIQSYMNTHGIKLIDAQKKSFRPDSIASHEVFFDKYIYKYLINDLRSFTINMNNIKRSFTSVIDSVNKGPLYEGFEILEDIIQSYNDDKIRDVTAFLNDLTGELNSFNKATMEKDLWYSNILGEITGFIVGKN
jgi:hypothetical protein